MESEAPVSGMQANGGSSVECDTSVPSSGGIDLRSIINPCKLPTYLPVCECVILLHLCPLSYLTHPMMDTCLAG